MAMGGEGSEGGQAAGSDEGAAAGAGDDGRVYLDLVGRTDVGLVREHNEDNLICSRLDDKVRDFAQLRRHALGERGTLLVVCDGMGGAAAGEIASGMAVVSVAAAMEAEGAPAAPEGVVDDTAAGLARKLRAAAQGANEQIYREARQNVARSGMGTTMTAALLSGGDAIIAQVGDSRCYVWRDGTFTQVTRDQSLVNQLIESGHITQEQAKYFEHSNVILQALGVQEQVDVQLSRVSLRRGDRVMLCSDGLVGVVSDAEIAAVMGACADPEEAARVLIELANAAGGPDNITVVVAHLSGALPEPRPEDRIEYKLWRIDPEVEEPPPLTPGLATTAPVPALEQEDAPPEPVPLRTLEVLSMAVVGGLLLGSLVWGVLKHQTGVVCAVEASEPSARLLADGVDTGLRTPLDANAQTPGRLAVRLGAGRHLLSLEGQAGQRAAQEIEARPGTACTARLSGASGVEPAAR